MQLFIRSPDPDAHVRHGHQIVRFAGRLPSAPEGFDLDLALAAIGYDPATPEASRRAFRPHFMADASDPPPARKRDLAHCQLRQKRAPEVDIPD